MDQNDHFAAEPPLESTDTVESTTAVEETASAEAFVEEILSSTESELPAEELRIESIPDKKKVRWWMIAVSAILLFAVLAAFLWKPILVRVAPTLVLSQAMVNTGEDFVSRLENTPLTAVPSGDNTTVSMQTDISYAGYMNLHLDCKSQSDLLTQQSDLEFHAQLNAFIFSYEFDISGYADPDFAALNWSQITGDTYYGINFDTFGDELRANPFLYQMLGEEGTAEAERYITQYRKQLEFQAMCRQGLELNPEYARIVTEFVSGLDAEVSTQALSIGNQERKCYRIGYSIGNAELAGLLEQLVDVAENDETVQLIYENYVGVSSEEMTWETFIEDLRESIEELEETEGTSEPIFYLYNDRIVNITLDYNDDEDSVSLQLLLGENTSSDDISVVYTVFTGNSEEVLELNFEIDKTDTVTEEIMHISLTEPDTQTDLMLGYCWDRTDGRFTVSIMGNDGVEEVNLAMDMTLQAGEGSLVFEIGDIADMLRQAVPDSVIPEDFTASFHYEIAQGTEIVIPEYTSIVTVSDDLIVSLIEKIENYFS